RFDLITEDIASGKVVSQISRSGQVIELSWKNRGKKAPETGRPPARLALCRNCRQYIHQHETTCPHCKGDVIAAERLHRQKMAERDEAIQRLRSLLGEVS
ncbi:hypothetical protein PWG14_23305, partial [Chromobacterium amazonense]